MKITNRIHFNLRVLLYPLYLVVCLCIIHWLGKYGCISFVAVFALITGMRPPAPTLAGDTELDKYIREVAKGSPWSGMKVDTPPPDLEIHLISNPQVPAEHKSKYAADTPEGKQVYLTGYWQRLQRLYGTTTE